MTTLSRRGILVRAGQLLLAITGGSRLARATPPGGAADAELPGQLAQLIAELFPGLLPGTPFYSDVAAAVLQRATAAPGQLGAVRSGLAKLSAAAEHADWQSVLPRFESEPFFAFVYSASVELVYRDPRVWDAVGYGGNALARGGYLNNGFDDIDWLPSGVQE